jgi:hypothetical protein
MACWKTLDECTKSHSSAHARASKTRKCVPPSVRVLKRNGGVGDDQISGRVEPFVASIERRPLTGLGNGTLLSLCRSLENIDFGSRTAHERAVAVCRSRMCFTGASATGEALTREVRKIPQVILVAWIKRDVRYPFVSLVWNGPDVAGIVGVRPL